MIKSGRTLVYYGVGYLKQVRQIGKYFIPKMLVSLAGTLRFDVSYGEQGVLGTSLTDKYRL